MHMVPTFCLVFFIHSFVAMAGGVDLLKPEYSRKSLELRRLMEEIAQRGLQYEITHASAKREAVFFGRHEWVEHIYHVKMPKEVRAVLHDLDDAFIRGEMSRYLNDKSYSFYAAALLMSWLDNVEHGAVFHIRLESLEKNDKTMWDESIERNIAFFAGLLGDAPLKAHLFRDAIPQKYQAMLLLPNDNKARIGDVFHATPLDGVQEDKFQAAVNKYIATEEESAVAQIPCDRKHFEQWLTPLLLGATNGSEVVRGFVSWCRQSGSETGQFPAAAMGLFTVFGYSYDDMRDRYELTERGKILLDYIVAFPIPENAGKLSVIADGGNLALVNALMRKHGTAQTWERYGRK